MKLHLGCGKVFIPGFVHVDLQNYSHVDHVCDVRELPFEDESTSLIYACQVLQYFDRSEVWRVLNEWKRVLEPNGVLRLSVPNFDVLCRAYNMGLDLSWLQGTLYGRIPHKDGYIYHKMMYDESTLGNVLENAGFDYIREWDWRETEHSQIDDFSQAYFPHMEKERGLLWNLNMEATNVVLAD